MKVYICGQLMLIGDSTELKGSQKFARLKLLSVVVVVSELSSEKHEMCKACKSKAVHF